MNYEFKHDFSSESWFIHHSVLTAEVTMTAYQYIVTSAYDASSHIARFWNTILLLMGRTDMKCQMWYEYKTDSWLDLGSLPHTVCGINSSVLLVAGPVSLLWQMHKKPSGFAWVLNNEWSCHWQWIHAFRFMINAKELLLFEKSQITVTLHYLRMVTNTSHSINL